MRKVSDDLPHLPVFFTCDDIEQTHRELSERGGTFPTGRLLEPVLKIAASCGLIDDQR